MKKPELIKLIKEEINEIIQGRGLSVAKQIIQKMESPKTAQYTDRDRIIDLYEAVKALVQHAEDQQGAE